MQMFKQSRFLQVLALILILGIVFCSYWPSLFNGFTSWDDNLYVIENETIRNLSWPTVKTIFTTDVSLNYTPLTILSFALEYHFWGYKPFFYHLDNLLLHLLVTVSVFFFALRLSSSMTVASAASLLFGIHPMHVESVAWVTERKDVLYAVFYMLALGFYLRYLADKRKVFYAASLVCGFLSILAKPMALSLPFVLIILDWFLGRKCKWKILLEKIPFGLVIFPIAWLTYSLNSRVIVFKFPDAILTWLWTGTFYIKKFFLPFNFLPLYELSYPVHIANPEFIGALVVTVFIIGVLFCLRKDHWLVFAFLFYFFSIFFLLRFDYSVDLSVVADRFMYLPSVGFCILLGIFFKRALFWVKNKKMIFHLVFASLLCSGVYYLGFSTFAQTKIWGDGVAFWSSVLKHYPTSAMAYNQRALAYKEQGDLPRALADYTKAIMLLPDYDFALTNRGIVYKELGMFAEAWADHSRAIVVNPDFSEAYLNRGNVSFSVGDFKRAIVDYDKAIATMGVSARRASTLFRAEAYSRRGSGYFFARDYDAALRDFDQALKINPDNIVALDNRAIIFSIRGQKIKALADFAHSLRLAPNNPVSYVNRAQLYYQSADKLAALQDLQAALKLNPNDKRALELKLLILK